MTKGKNDSKLRQVEAHLSGALKPLTLPGDFSHRVRAKVRFPEREMLAKRLSNWEFALIVTGGVMSAALAITAFARALYYFFRKSGGSRAGA